MTATQREVLSVLQSTHVCSLHISYRTGIPFRDVEKALNRLVQSGDAVKHVKGEAKAYSLPPTFTRLKNVIQ